MFKCVTSINNKVVSSLTGMPKQREKYGISITSKKDEYTKVTIRMPAW